MAYGLPKKREEVVKTLEQAYLEGNLDETSYEQRLTLAYEAKTVEELKEVLYDFPQQIKLGIFPEKKQSVETSHSQFTTEYRPKEMLGQAHKVIMSEQTYPLSVITNRAERFTILLGNIKIKAENAQVQGDTCQINVDCWLGNTKINLKNPELAGKEVHLHIHGGLGEVNIYVPPGTSVSRPIQLILGEYSHRKKNILMHLFDKNKNVDEEGWAFHLVIHGSFVMGSVRVRY